MYDILVVLCFYQLDQEKNAFFLKCDYGHSKNEGCDSPINRINTVVFMCLASPVTSFFLFVNCASRSVILPILLTGHVVQEKWDKTIFPGK